MPKTLIPELLAPAGDWKSLDAALDAGADAIYFGVRGFNMRAAAKNFTTRDLPKITARCHERKVMAYLTLNVVVFERELTSLNRLLIAAKTADVDGVIGSDFAVLAAAAKEGLALHVSTQMSVANSASIEFLYKLGVRRFVLARECSLEDIRKIQAAMPRETIVVPDVGLNQIWTVRTWQSHSPRSLLTSGGMGTMGFSVPAAIGAKVGAPDRDVVVICGDGGFYMNIQELATISSYRLPIKIIVINNGHLGMIRQIQDLFYESRFTTSELGDTVDLTAVARGFGIPAERVAVDDDPAEAIARMSAAEGPYMVEAMVDQNNYVYPIIPPGCSNMEMICGK